MSYILALCFSRTSPWNQTILHASDKGIYLIKSPQILTDIERYPADPKSKFSLSLWTLTFGLQKIWLEIIWKAGSIFQVPFLKNQVFQFSNENPSWRMKPSKLKFKVILLKYLVSWSLNMKKLVFSVFPNFLIKSCKFVEQEIMFRAFAFWITMYYV